MKNIIQILLLTYLFQTFHTLINAQNTFVPDDNFEQALIDLGYDSGALDDFVPTANIMDVTDLNLYQKDISDLTGIEDFSSLEELNFSNNNVSTVDLSALSLLKELELGNNIFTTLDLSANAALEQLFCGNNQLTSLNLHNNPNLNYLACNNNQITNLDLSNNPQLEVIAFQSNQLSNLDLQYNSLLFQLQGDNNPLTTLDLSNNTEIQKVFCSHTEISSIIFPDNCKIYRLSCESANLSEIDVSGLADLDFISVYNNDLISLDLSNNLLLTELLCGKNQLKSILIPESNIISKLDCRGNELSNLEELLNVDNGSNTIQEQNPALFTLNITRNNFDFSDLEPLWAELSELISFSYDEQNKIGERVDTIIEQGRDFTIEIADFTSSSNDQYQWYKNSEILDGETGVTLSFEPIDYSDEGTYHCEVINSVITDLTLTSEYFIIEISEPTGIESIGFESIFIYPNPASDFINIESEDFNTQFQLFNLKGERVLDNFTITKGKIDISNLPKGMYFLTISALSENRANKVMIY